jgi:hypothetical protein
MVKLKKNTTFEATGSYGLIPVRVNEIGYLCLNDMEKFYEGKYISNYMRNDSTQELIREIEVGSNSVESDGVKTNAITPALIAKMGRYGGTYAHPIVALDFAAWLDVKLRVNIYQVYLEHLTGRDTWNLKRLESASAAKLLNDSIKEFLMNPPSSDNPHRDEAWLIKSIILGSGSAGDKYAWDGATSEQLEMREYLERIDMGLIIAGLSINERRTKLVEQYNKKVKGI